MSKGIEEIARDLYTVHNVSYLGGTLNTVVTDVKEVGSDGADVFYELSYDIIKNIGSNTDTTHGKFKFRVIELRNTLSKTCIQLAKVDSPIKVRGGGPRSLPEVMTGIVVEGVEGTKNSIYLGGVKNEGSVNLRKNGLHINLKDNTFLTFDKAIIALQNDDKITAATLIGDEAVDYVLNFNMSDRAVEKLKLLYDLDYINPRLIDQDTYKIISDLAKGFGPKGTPARFFIEQVTPYDVEMLDYYEGLVDHLRKKKTYMGMKGTIRFHLNKNATMYPNAIETGIKSFYKSASDAFNMIQFTQDSSPLSMASQSKKIFFFDWEKFNDDKNPISMKKSHMRVNSPFMDGILDPTRTREPVESVNRYNEITIACDIKRKAEESKLKVYDKDFNEKEIPMKEFLNSKILSYECIDYKQKKIIPNRDGTYKYCRRTRYYSTNNLNDIDYLRHQGTMLSVSTSVMPLMNRNDTTRDLLQSGYATQFIPVNGSHRPIIHTQFNNYLYNSDIGRSIKSELSGTVVSISKEMDSIKVKTDDGKINYINLPEDASRFNSTKSHTANIYNPTVNIGDHINVGDVAFALNSFKKGELALGVPLLTTYSTLRGLENEDAYVLSASALSKFDHPMFKEVRVKLVTGGYRLTETTFPNIGEQLDEDEVYFSHYLVEKTRALQSKISLDLAEYKAPKFSYNCTIIDIKVHINPNVNMTSDNYRRIKAWKDQLIQSSKEFYDNPIFDYPYPTDCDNCDFVIDFSISYYNKMKLSDKLGNRISNKGVLVAVIPDDQMLRTENGEVIECVMPALAMASRKNTFCLIEAKLTKLSKKLLEIIKSGKINTVKPVLDVLFKEIPEERRYLASSYIGTDYEDNGFLRIEIDPFDSLFNVKGKDITEVIDELMLIAGIPNGGKEYLIDGKTGRKIRTPLLVGYNEFHRFHFIAENKITASPDVSYTRGKVIMGIGKEKDGGQKFGEQEVSAFMAHGADEFLALRTVKSKRFNKLSTEFNNILMRLSVGDEAMDKYTK